MSSEAQPAAVEDGGAAAGGDELARIEAALDRLTGPAPGADQPLVEIAARLDDLHQELQSALTGLDRS